jgi:hypothetical protein
LLAASPLLKPFFHCFHLIHISSLTYGIKRLIYQIENESAKVEAIFRHEGNILQGIVQDSYYIMKTPTDPTVISVRLYVAEGD